jgi:electron transport complex protein RnfC
MRKIWNLIGGVHPPENKHQSVKDSVGSLPLPEKLTIPLNQHIGAPSKAIVAIGDKVLKGQVLANPKGVLSAGVHAPTSGLVSDIGDHPIPHPSGMSAHCITLIPDGEDQWIAHEGLSNYRDHVPEKLLEIIRLSGVAGLGGAGFPTAVKLNPQKPISTLILNGTECEPYITSDDMLMREHPEDIVQGIEILSYILGDPKEVVIGVEDNKPEAYAALKSYLKNTTIELATFETRYPSGGEKQLIQILTGTEVPAKGLPSDIGIACLNVGTAYAVYRAIVFGEPLISRITTVTGKACTINRNYEILIGTPISHLLKHNAFNKKNCSRLIVGGPMMGFALENLDIPVIKTTNCILAPSEEEFPSPQPAQACIRCGMCAEACPASLLPQQLLWYAQSKNYEKLEVQNLADCIECGACSYVCPSNIPLVQYYRASKGEMKKQAEEKVSADRARQRFEFQKNRKEKEIFAKKVQRDVRLKAAAQANKTSGTEGIIQAALDRAEAKKSSPEDQHSRSTRRIARFEDQLRSAQEKLESLKEGVTSDQHEQAKAAVEDAKIRLAEAISSHGLSMPISNPSETPDSASEAITRAQAKVTIQAGLSDEEKLCNTIVSLTARLEKATTRLEIAKTEGSEHIDAFTVAADKLKEKLATAEADLSKIRT